MNIILTNTPLFPVENHGLKAYNVQIWGFSLIKNITKNKVLARKILASDSIIKKVFGLMFMKKHNAMVFSFNIEKKRFFHTMFMNFDIDFLFLDSNKKITKILRKVKPWRLNISGNCRYVIELPSGESSAAEKGDVISFK